MTFFGPDLRNGLPIGLGSVAGFGSARQFSPLSLFAGGVQGTWYDPSDLTTLFQDSAGTTPVTGVEQVVGLMLDKSQGLVLGSELVTNGDFSGGTTTGWTPQSAALSVVGGQLSVVPSTAFGYAYQTITTVAGTTYKITFDYNQSTAVFARYFVGTSLGGDQLIALTTAPGVGSITRYFTATTTTTFIHFGAQSSSGLQALFDNISVKALSGNHATATGSARPTLSARVNLVTNSENFAGTGWSGTATIATDVTTAPNGTTTADSITAAATSANQYIRRSPAGLLVNVQFTWSVAAKKNTSDWVYLRFWDTSNAGIGNTVWFNVANGTVGSNTAGTVGSITNLGDGWYRCTATRTIGGSIAFNEVDIAVSNADNTINATAGNSVFLWGADLRPTNIGSQIPAYQRVVTATNYDSTGFPLYLSFAGAQAMSTPANVNLSGTDKATVFAGVRKLSDAATAFVVTQNGAAATNGFFLRAPSGAAANYAWMSAGSAFLGGTATTGNTFAAPISNVLTGIGDIAADTATLRANGVQAATSAADQGTGNYSNLPVFVGARNDSTSFLTGNIYSLLVVGSAVSAGNITSTETWVNGKTGGVY